MSHPNQTTREAEYVEGAMYWVLFKNSPSGWHLAQCVTAFGCTEFYIFGDEVPFGAERLSRIIPATVSDPPEVGKMSDAEHDIKTLQLLYEVAIAARVTQKAFNAFDDWSHRSTFSDTEMRARKHADNIGVLLCHVAEDFDLLPEDVDVIADAEDYALNTITDLQRTRKRGT